MGIGCWRRPSPVGDGGWHQSVRGVSAQMSINTNSAQPLNILTGFDDNGDLIFNDRPAGEARNSARTTRAVEFIGVLQLPDSARQRAPSTRGRVWPSRRKVAAWRSHNWRRSDDGAVSAGARREHPEHVQPAELLRLQRRDDVAQLPETFDGAGRPADHVHGWADVLRPLRRRRPEPVPATSGDLRFAMSSPYLATPAGPREPGGSRGPMPTAPAAMSRTVAAVCRTRCHERRRNTR